METSHLKTLHLTSPQRVNLDLSGTGMWVISYTSDQRCLVIHQIELGQLDRRVSAVIITAPIAVSSIRHLILRKSWDKTNNELVYISHLPMGH